VIATIPGYKQSGNGGNFLLCTTAAGVGGTSAAPYLFVNLGAYSYQTPAGCADGVRLFFNPVRNAAHECGRRSTTTTVRPRLVGTERKSLGVRVAAIQLCTCFAAYSCFGYVMYLHSQLLSHVSQPLCQHVHVYSSMSQTGLRKYATLAKKWDNNNV
jgi:hypothetical protein